MSKPQTADFSIRLPGTLTVKKHAGNYRSFTVAELATPLAEFKVTDKWVEQLDAGTYEGDFWIARIEPIARSWRTRLFVEVQARVIDYRLKEAERPASGSDAFPEQDPLDNEAASTPKLDRPAPTHAKRSSEPSKPRTRQPQAKQREEASKQLSDLFGDELAQIITAGIEPVRLDSTIDRQLLRQQIHYLREELKFKLDVAEQHWLPPHG